MAKFSSKNTELLLDSNVPLSLNQLNDVNDTVSFIVDNLSGDALKELLGGYENDIDLVLQNLYKETINVFGIQNRLLSNEVIELDKLYASAEESLRCYSFNYFILSVLPDFILGWHNIEWGNLTQIFRLLCIKAARDHGKSHEFSFAYPIWQLYRYKDNMRGLIDVPRELQMAKDGMIITNEYGLAGEFLAKIKEEIEYNEILRNKLYPGKRGWGAEKIITKTGSRIIIKSANSKIRGHHPTWIVLDDFLNESSLYSQEQRDKYWNVFSGVIYPALSPGGQMIVVGTPFFEKDLYGILQEHGIFKVFEYPAIFPDGRLLFPERHTFKSLLEKRELLGSLIFSREILVKPISDGSTIFPWSILKNSIRGQDSVDLVYNIRESKRKFIRIVVGCDFAISSNIGADYSVFVVLGEDELGNFHILNCWRKKGANYSQQMAALKKINVDFEPDLFVLETNGMQEIFLDMSKDANLPVVGNYTGANKKSLYKGVPSLAILFETFRIKFPYGTQKAKDLTDLFHSELNSITYIQDKGKLESTTQHDDTSMALWQAIKGLKWSIEDFEFNFL